MSAAMERAVARLASEGAVLAGACLVFLRAEIAGGARL